MPLDYLLAIDVGTAPGSRDGDPGRTCFQKINLNSGYIAGAVEDAEVKSFIIALTGTDAEAVVGENIKSFRMPYPFLLLDVRADVDEAPAGADLVVDVKANGSSVLLTGLYIADGEEYSDPVVGGAIVTSSISAAGTGYAPLDEIYIPDNVNPGRATLRVDTVGGSGEVLTYTVLDAGSVLHTGLYGGATDGAGINFVLDVTEVSTVPMLDDPTILADRTKMSFHVLQVGETAAPGKGLTITLIGYKITVA